MTAQKGFAHIILLLFIVLGIGGFVAYSLFQPMTPPSIVEKINELTIPSDWKTYTAPNNKYSFRYPSDFTIYDVNPEPVFYFPKKEGQTNSAHFEIEILKNEYNRPFEKRVAEYIRGRESENTKTAGLPAVKVRGRFGENTFEYFVDNNGILYQIRLYNYGAIETNEKLFEKIVTTLTFSKPEYVDTEISVVDGDIVTKKHGKLTHWGYNFAPLISPDGTKIAYLSETEKTIDEKKNQEGFIPFSYNVYVMNADGSNAKKVTDHEDFVNRKLIKWVDNTRLLFEDGELTVKIYSLPKGLTTTLVGPETPQPSCVDSCYGWTVWSLISPNQTYFVSLYKPDEETKMQIANLNTLESYEITNNYAGCIQDVEFEDENTVTFMSTLGAPELDCSSEGLIKVTVDLEKKTVKAN